MTRPLEVVGLVEIAELLGVERATVRTWYSRGRLPEPDARLAATPVWRLTTIKQWIRQDRWGSVYAFHVKNGEGL